MVWIYGRKKGWVMGGTGWATDYRDELGWFSAVFGVSIIHHL